MLWPEVGAVRALGREFERAGHGQRLRCNGFKNQKHAPIAPSCTLPLKGEKPGPEGPGWVKQQQRQSPTAKGTRRPPLKHSIVNHSAASHDLPTHSIESSDTV